MEKYGRKDGRFKRDKRRLLWEGDEYGESTEIIHK